MINLLVLLSLLVPTQCAKNEKMIDCDLNIPPEGGCYVFRTFEDWYNNHGGSNIYWSCSCKNGACGTIPALMCNIVIFQVHSTTPCDGPCYTCYKAALVDECCWVEKICVLMDPSIPCVTETMCVPVIIQHRYMFNCFDWSDLECCPPIYVDSFIFENNYV